MQKNFLKGLSIFLITTAFFSSCIDKNYDFNDLPDKISYSPTNGLPLPFGSLRKSVLDVLDEIGIDSNEDQYIIVEGDTIYIMYIDTLSFSSEKDNMLPLPTTEYAVPRIGNDYLNYITNFPPISLDFVVPEDTWAVKLDSAQLINSALKIHAKSTLATTATFTLNLSNGLEYKEPNGGVVQIPANSDKDYILKLKDHTIFNLLTTVPGPNGKLQYKFSLTALLDAKGFSASNYLELKISFESLDAEVLWGDFSNVEFDPISGKKNVGIFSDLQKSGSKLLFSNPSLTCKIANYIGIGGNLIINSVKTSKKDEIGNIIQGSTNSAIFKNNKDTCHIPLAAASRPNEATYWTSRFDKDNGRIDKLFFQENSPNNIEYEFVFQPNPGKSGGKSDFFVKGGKYIDVAVEARLPLSFNSGTAFNSNDTLDLDLTEQGNIEDLKNLILFFDYKNRFRIDMSLDLDFLDENKSVIPNLSKKFKMDAAENIPNPKPGEGLIKLEFDESKSTDLRKTKHVVLKTSVKNSSSGEINIYPTDYFEVGLSVYAKFKVTF